MGKFLINLINKISLRKKIGKFKSFFKFNKIIEFIVKFYK